MPTIISQNCLGGIIYHALRQQFSSPTINLTIEGEDFVNFVEHLQYYIETSPKMITDCYLDGLSNQSYPRIMIDDVVVNCIHYKTCAEAIEKWERRKKRIEYSNICVIANTWDLNEDEKLIKRITSTNYKTVVFTTNGKYKDYDKVILVQGEFGLDGKNNPYPSPINFMPHSSVRYFENVFPFVDWLLRQEDV